MRGRALLVVLLLSMTILAGEEPKSLTTPNAYAYGDSLNATAIAADHDILQQAHLL